MNNAKAEVDLTGRLEQAKSKVAIGARYQHYKGLEYRVVYVCLREEDLEPCVVYQAMYGDEIIWVRPVSSWPEEVDVEGTVVQRFKRVEN